MSMSTQIQNTLAAPFAQSFQTKLPFEDSAGASRQDDAEDFDRIDLPGPRRILTVEFVHVGRRPIRVSEHWEE